MNNFDIFLKETVETCLCLFIYLSRKKIEKNNWNFVYSIFWGKIKKFDRLPKRTLVTYFLIYFSIKKIEKNNWNFVEFVFGET